MAVASSPVVALNRAVAVAEFTDRLPPRLVDDLDLDSYYLFHAIRADLLRRLGSDAALAYDAAIGRTKNTAEREFLWRSRDALTGAHCTRMHPTSKLLATQGRAPSRQSLACGTSSMSASQSNTTRS